MDIIWLLASIVIIIICVVGIIRQGFNKKRYLIIGIIVLLIDSLFIINFLSMTKNINLTNDFLDKMISIDWTDQQVMNELGLEGDNGFYRIKQSDNDSVRCSIYVGGYYQDIIEYTKEHTNYKNLYYEATEGGAGIFDIDRLLKTNDYVTRRYYFVVNNVPIAVIEYAPRNTPDAFKEYIDSLSLDQITD